MSEFLKSENLINPLLSVFTQPDLCINVLGIYNSFGVTYNILTNLENPSTLFGDLSGSLFI